MIKRTIYLLMKYFIEKKEFFLYPYKEIQSILDISLHKQIWFSHFFVDFVHKDFLEGSIEYQKSIIYNHYHEIKQKNTFKKLFFYKIIVLENSFDHSLDHLDALSSWLKEEKINIHLIVIDASSNQVFSLFSNFKDQEQVENFIHETILSLPYETVETIDLLEIENMTRDKKGYSFKNKKSYVTHILMGLNIIYFIYISITGSSTDIDHIINLGAKYNPLIASGEYYRLITSMFIHIGITHLLFNTYALKSLGKDVEFMYGSLKFFIIYMIAGLFGSLSSFLFSSAVSAGASGAIFGLMGAYLYFGIQKPSIFSARYGLNMVSLIIINIVFGLTNSNIDNFAHLGGLIGGFLASYALGLKTEKFLKLKKVTVQFLIITIIVGSLIGGSFIQIQSWQHSFHMGIYYLKKNDLSHAKLQFQEGIEKNDQIPEFYFYLAYVSYQEGDKDTTIHYLEKTLSINPNHSMARNFLNDIQGN
ncbi:rhomboid family protein [Crassaminicella profunda]|uniref:rhomboid family protein n=1 Tax=Crassaminicella profunda TaxID=1286698 RepID=UPI001CA6DB63|nr:rhomboid family intramembrane serine protease [Crassaminicella profunda]QZY56336.1 rhomboid family intramembrane serine protease [Crassaminicella profunda]